MQIFNEINARKLGERDFNVFAGFFNNYLFLLIILGTLTIQIILVQFGGVAVRTTPLTVQQHLICLAFGAGSLVWGVIIKFVPARIFGKIHVDETPIPEGKVPLTKSIRGRSMTKSRLGGSLGASKVKASKVVTHDCFSK